jgi:phage shock protein A
MMDGTPPHVMNDAVRKAIDVVGRKMKPFRGLQDGVAQELNSSAVAQKAMEASLGPLRDLEARIKSLDAISRENSSLGRLAEQVRAQKNAIDAMGLDERKMLRIPDLTNIPPNPIVETNKRLERIEERFEQMQIIAKNAAEIATGLQGAAVEFLQKFEKAASDNDRTAGRAIWIGIFAVFIAIAMPTVQIIYSEYRREPSNSAEIQALFEAMQFEIATMRNAQASASERLTEVLVTSDSQTAAILQDIRGLLAGKTVSPPATTSEPSQ